MQNELNIQKYLRAGGSLEKLTEDFGIYSTVKDGKVILTYDQIESSKCKAHPIVKECRGLILYTDNYDTAAMSFERFFNYGETGAEALGNDFSKLLCLPKLDGTLITLWNDRTDSKWKVSTRGMMYAEGRVGTLSTKSFADLFWEAVKDTNIPDFADQGTLGNDISYIFELTSPENRIVTPYTTSRATLLTMRNKKGFGEFLHGTLAHTARDLNVDYVKPVPMTDWQTLLSMQGLAAMDEGYVLVEETNDLSHKRVKVKNPAYLAISHTVQAPTEKNFLRLVQEGAKTGAVDEYLVYYPEYTPMFHDIMDKLDIILYRLIGDWANLSGVEDRKTFALYAKETPFPNIMFLLKDGRICRPGEVSTEEKPGIVEYLYSLSTEKLLDMIRKV